MVILFFALSLLLLQQPVPKGTSTNNQMAKITSTILTKPKGPGCDCIATRDRQAPVSYAALVPNVLHPCLLDVFINAEFYRTGFLEFHVLLPIS